MIACTSFIVRRWVKKTRERKFVSCQSCNSRAKPFPRVTLSSRKHPYVFDANFFFEFFRRRSVLFEIEIRARIKFVCSVKKKRKEVEEKTQRSVLYVVLLLGVCLFFFVVVFQCMCSLGWLVTNYKGLVGER